MIRYIEGEYFYYSKGAVVIKTDGGLSFRIFVADSSKVLLIPEGERIQLFTHLVVKEDEMSLYGFDDRESLELFEQFITVNGIGPKAAMNIMCLAAPDELKRYIKSKDASFITRANGIGKKTADRLILELADKIEIIENDFEERADSSVKRFADNEDKKNAITALTTLGYSKKESEEAVLSIEDNNLSVEDYVKSALKYLYK